MDTFDVDKLMRYDALKEEWDAVADRDHKPPGEKPEIKARDDLVHSAPTAATNPPSPPEPTPAQRTVPHPPEIETLRRGQRLEFIYGARTWHSVYWGKDDGGHVIAHNTFKDWALTRLDLNQYIDKIIIEPEPDRELVQAIEQSLYHSGHAQAA